MYRVPFLFSYAAIRTFFDLFTSSRLIFTKEFGLNLIKLVFIEMQGIDVTLVYIESMMKKVFTDRLLDFLRITTEPEDSGEIVSKGKKVDFYESSSVVKI